MMGAGLMLVLLAMIAFAALLYHKRKSPWRSSSTVVVKILLTFFEMISVLNETFMIRWPYSYRVVVSHVRAALAGIAELSALACGRAVNQLVHLLVWTLLMLALPID